MREKREGWNQKNEGKELRSHLVEKLGLSEVDFHQPGKQKYQTKKNLLVLVKQYYQSRYQAWDQKVTNEITAVLKAPPTL